MEVNRFMMIFFSFSLKYDFSNKVRVWKKICEEKETKIKKWYILLFKGLPLFGILIFLFKNTLSSICLNRDKIKGQSCKNTTLISTKTLQKKIGPLYCRFSCFFIHL